MNKIKIKVPYLELQLYKEIKTDKSKTRTPEMAGNLTLPLPLQNIKI
jgi:hypothetical protein